MTNQNKPHSKSAKAQEIIRVTTDAMAPQLLPGDILFLERREPTDIMVYGLPYVVILKSKHIYIRRVYPGGHPYIYYDLKADNADIYPMKSIEREDVESIITIVKVIRYMTERIEFI